MGFQHTNSYTQCTAKSKRSGARCKNASMKGRTVCRMHGGKSLRGISSATHDHGYHSKDWYSKFIWSQIKGIWRDCVQDMWIVIAQHNAPGEMTIKHPYWQRYQADCMKALRQAIPDIPAELYSVLWDSFEFGQSGKVKIVIRDYLLSLDQ